MAVIEVCLVPDCKRVADARGLCKKHYLSLSRALKEGVQWDMQTGKPVPSGYRPYSFLADLPERPTTNASHDELAAIRQQVEVDAARVLPFALAYCIGATLKRTGLLDNPAAATAFAETCTLGQPVVDSRLLPQAAASGGRAHV